MSPDRQQLPGSEPETDKYESTSLIDAVRRSREILESAVDGRVQPLETFTVVDAEKYISDVRWQFAKTMPQWPHWYTVREWRLDLQPQFEAFTRLIRLQGIVAPWPRDSANPRYRNAYLSVGNWMYWTMPGTVAEQSVINRAAPDL